MELAIPGIALGLMYIMKGQSNNTSEQEESFANQNAFEAITKSAQLIFKNPFIIFGLIIVGIIGIFIGLIGLCIGIFFTMPFWYSLTYTIYNNIIPINEESEIEEIGNNLE